MIGAAAASDPFTTYLINVGVAGIWLLTILVGQMFPKAAWEDKQRDLERLRAQVDTLLADWLRVVPLLNETNAMLIKLKEEERRRREREWGDDEDAPPSRPRPKR